MRLGRDQEREREIVTWKGVNRESKKQDLWVKDNYVLVKAKWILLICMCGIGYVCVLLTFQIERECMGLCISMHVYDHVCMRIYVYDHVCVWMYVCMNIHVFMSMCVCMNMCYM